MITFSKEDLILVTGGSSGIGEAIVNKLAELGAIVIAVSSNIDKLKRMKELSTFSHNIRIEEFDLNKIENISTFILSLVEKYGKIKSFVHSAGISKTVPFVSKVNIDKKIFDINYFSGVEIARAFINKNVHSGNNSSIIFISSISSLQAFPGAVAYSASKGAVNSFVRSLAAEVAKKKIRVNAVLPGFIKTEMLNELIDLYGEIFVKELEKKYPLGLGDPEDVANLVAFLLSEKAKWITGACYVIDGGGSIV